MSEGIANADIPEIEIALEMIEAGIEAMWGFEVFDGNRDEWRVAIREAFLLMFGMRGTGHV